MEIKLKGITKVFPGNPKKHIKDTVAVDDFVGHGFQHRLRDEAGDVERMAA